MASTTADTRDCALCTAATGVTPAHFPVPANQVLQLTEHFVLVPALGPIVPGHALAVGRRHAGGLLTTAEDAQADYGRLAVRLRAHCAARGQGLLEVEHGGTTAGTRGPCIDHTHVHLLPGLGHCLRAMEGRLPRLTAAPRDTAPFRPYMWVRSGAVEAWYDAANAIGQEARRAIGAALRLDDWAWDWAVNPGWKVIEETIGYWTPRSRAPRR